MCKCDFNLNIFFYFIVSFFIFSFCYLLGYHNQSCNNPMCSNTKNSPFPININIYNLNTPKSKQEYRKKPVDSYTKSEDNVPLETKSEDFYESYDDFLTSPKANSESIQD